MVDNLKGLSCSNLSNLYFLCKVESKYISFCFHLFIIAGTLRIGKLDRHVFREIFNRSFLMALSPFLVVPSLCSSSLQYLAPQEWKLLLAHNSCQDQYGGQLEGFILF